MKLTDLEPRWVYKQKAFVFRCPHCRKTWLSCKRVPMSIGQQIEIFQAAGLDPQGPKYAVVPMREEVAWAISGDGFSTMTVKPSIDASGSGHWHGHITNGEIR